ncbi:MAG: FAD-dependent oxidoreductase, partial [Phycisphaerae bacterium]
NLDIRTRSEVRSIDRRAKTVRVYETKAQREYDESYDDLLLSPGATPVRPPIPGSDHPAIHTLRNLVDMDRIKQAADANAESAVVVGGGFVGLEMAENLKRRGLAVSLVELLPQVMPPLDPEIAARLHQELTRNGVALFLEDSVTKFEDAGGRVRGQLESGRVLEADLVLLSVGIRPETQIARAAGLELNERGAIVVDEHMRTSDPYIYAVGDAVQVHDPVLGGTTLVPLAGPANRQARIAADNIFGRASTFRGSQGTSIVRLFDATVAATGASEKLLKLRQVRYKKVYVHRGQHAGYFPGSRAMMIKLLFAPDNGRILGAQIVGGAGVDKRIDVLAVAIQAEMTVYDLEEVELAYAPQYGAAKDPINIVGFVAANALRGDEDFVYAEELDEASRDNWTIIDVRSPQEYESGQIPGAVLLPLPELRRRWQEIPQDKPIVTYCGVGQRAYYANRILRQKGVHSRNLAGGFTTYQLVHAAKPSPARAAR